MVGQVRSTLKLLSLVPGCPAQGGILFIRFDAWESLAPLYPDIISLIQTSYSEASRARTLRFRMSLVKVTILRGLG